MCMKYFLCLLAFVLVTFKEVLGQNAALDSLRNALRQHTVKDTLYLQNLLELAAKTRSVDMGQSIRLYEEAIILSQQLSASRFEIKSHNGLGICYGMHDRYPQAVQHFNSALKLAMENNYPLYAGDSYNSLGIVYKRIGDYPTSLSYYAKAMHLYDSLGNEESVASCSQNLGILYDLMKEPEKALEYYETSLEIFRKYNDDRSITSLNSNIAMLHLQRGDFKEAIEIYENNMDFFSRNSMKTHRVQELASLGYAYHKIKAYEKAEVCLSSAIEEAEKLDLDEVKVNALYSLAKTKADLGNFPQSLGLAEKARVVADSLHSFSLQSKAQELLSYVFEKSGNPGKALEHYKMHKAWEDSLFNEDKLKAYKSQQVLMEVHEKDRQLEAQSLRLTFLNEQVMLENKWKWTLGIASLFLLLTGVMYYQKYRARKDYSKQLEEQNSLITEQKEEIETINQQLEDQIILRKETDDTINYFATSLFGKNTVEEILWDVAKNCIARLGLVDCVIYLLDESRATLVQKAAYGTKNPEDFEIQNPIEIPIGSGIVGHVAQTGEAAIVNDTSLDSRYIVDDEARLSELAVPLKIQDKVIGVIDSEHPGKNFFTPFHVDALKTIASICSSKIAQVLAGEEARKAEKAQLEASQIKALDLVKSRFFANISHEFRTPLNLILGPLRTHGDRIPTKELSMMQRNAQRLLRLVNQLLDLSRLEVGQLQLEYRTADVFAFLRTLAASFSSMAEAKQIIYQVDIPMRGFPSRFDPDKMEKIVYNLLSNAVKFTPSGGTITFHAFIEQTNLRLSVSDTGLGIPAPLQDKIFDRFYQVDDTNTRAFEGTGIGLALVKELVDFHGGTISVDSEEKKGATFVVILPLQPADETSLEELSITELDHEDDSTMSPVKADDPVSEDAPLILIVEDNADLRHYILSNLGGMFSCREAVNGKIGWDIAVEELPDVIITDVMMPEMDGVELTHRVKNDERTSHIPVIMLTARDDLETRKAGFQTGADQYVTKPFDVEELQVRVHGVIRQRALLRKKFTREVTLKPQDVTVKDFDAIFLERSLRVVEEHLDDSEFSVEQLQQEVGMSRMQLHRKLKALTGQSASEFIREIRLERAAQLLQQPGVQVAEVAYNVGFTHLSYFAKCFKEKFNVSPSDFAKK